MKIESNLGLSIYRNTKLTGAQRSEAPPKTAKTDIAEFSHNSAPALDKALAAAKNSIVGSINAPADPERIEALRQSVRSGSYHIPTDLLVRSILDDEV